MEIPQVPKVFFIKGVFKHSASSIEHIVELHDDKNNIDDPETSMPMLKFYDDSKDDEWDAQREVRCATCPELISGRQKFIPQNIERIKTGMRYKCHDITRFCSWSCAAWHIRYFLNNDSRFKLLLNRLYEKWEDKAVVEIPPSIPPWRIAELGGDISLDSFHKLNIFNFQRFQSSFDDQGDHEFPILE